MKFNITDKQLLTEKQSLALRELPTHLRKARMWDKLCDVLTDFDYLQAKIGAHPTGSPPSPAPATIFELVQDFQNALEVLPREYAMREEVTVLFRVIDQNSHVLKDDPSLLVQQVYNAENWDTRKELGGRIQKAALCYKRRCWFRQTNPGVTVADLRVRRILTASDDVSRICFSPDGQTLASTGCFRIVLWDVNSGEQKDILLQARLPILTSVCFSPDGKTVAGTSPDRTVILWDIATGERKDILIGHADWVLSACFSPDGETLATASRDQKVILWDVVSGRQKAILKGHRDWVRSVRFSPVGWTLASASRDRSVILWGKDKTTRLQHIAPVSSICFSPNGQMLASGNSDGAVILWECSSGQKQAEFSGHSDHVLSICFSPDGQTLASGGQEGMVILWDVVTGQKKATLTDHQQHVTSVCFSPDGQTLAVADGRVVLWDTAGDALRPSKRQHRDSSSVRFTIVSPDALTLASATRDQTVILWDSMNREQKTTLMGHSGLVTSISFSPDGHSLASASEDQTVILWDVINGRQKAILKGHSESVRRVCFSPDGQTLASMGEDGALILWDAANGIQKAAVIGLGDWWRRNICFSPSGETLAYPREDGTLILWNVEAGDQMAVQGRSESVRRVCFSPDGQTMGGVSGETVILWDAASGKQKATLQLHDEVTSVCFSPNSEKLVICSLRTVILWNVTSGKQESLIGHRGQVILASFSEDSQIFASACSARMLIVWEAGSSGQLGWVPFVYDILGIGFHSSRSQLHVVDRGGPNNYHNNDTLARVDTGGARHVPNIYFFDIIRR